jgi:transcriptional regulator with XRE-family HTH domain
MMTERKGQRLKETLGKNIKFFRAHRQFSQADLAEKAKISITFLSNIERGNKWPYPDTLSQIAAGLKVDVYELFKPEIIPNEEHRKIFDRFARTSPQKSISL